MAWPVYTETFLRHSTSNSTARYYVPAGWRAVITSIASMVYGPTSSSTWVGVNDVPFWWHSYQAQPAAVTAGLRVVAYAGQSIDCYISASGVRTTVTGYLFGDPTGRSEDPASELIEGLPDYLRAAELSA